MIVIANCQIKNRMIPEHQLNRILEDCSNIGIEKHAICFNFSPIILQAGRQFELILNLLLPDTLPRQQIQQIQAGLPLIMAQHLGIRPDDIWLGTTIAQGAANEKQ